MLRGHSHVEAIGTAGVQENRHKQSARLVYYFAWISSWISYSFYKFVNDTNSKLRQQILYMHNIGVPISRSRSRTFVGFLSCLGVYSLNVLPVKRIGRILFTISANILKGGSYSKKDLLKAFEIQELIYSVKSIKFVLNIIPRSLFYSVNSRNYIRIIIIHSKTEIPTNTHHNCTYLNWL